MNVVALEPYRTGAQEDPGDLKVTGIEATLWNEEDGEDDARR